MLVKDLAALFEGRMRVSLRGNAEAEVTGVVYHSGKAGPGLLFAALPGLRDDGSKHVAEALARGARAVLHPLSARLDLPDLPPEAVLIEVEDARLALGLAADALAGHPSRRLTMVGVTGTNGKTTITWLVEAMAKAAGISCGVIGTIEYRLGRRVSPAVHTTPEAPDLQETLRWMADEGAKMVIMEVSSHALAQRRVEGTSFDYALFTNLSLDHLDFHGDMESYYQSKRRLFTDFDLKASLINLDDAWGRRLSGEVPGEVITFGRPEESLIRIREAAGSGEGIQLDLEIPGGSMHLHSSLLGEPNAQNVTAAAALGWRLGLPEEAIREGIASVRTVPGRFQKISRPGEPLTVVDYAHTPDALEKLLATARKLTAGRLILVFGCGGDRDRGKRPLMGEIAARGADLTFITSDNPRSEDPAAIIEAVLEGYRRVRADEGRVLENRHEAIKGAISEARPGDLVVIAGKGHEDYQILGQRKIHFDDREVAREALDAKMEMKA